jgi:drug/metabolite transporter (DMT)-like permease
VPAAFLPRLDPRLLPLAAAIAAPLIWSVGGVVMRSVGSAGPWEQVFWRALGGAGVVALALILVGWRRSWTEWRGAGMAAWGSAVCVAATFVVHVLAINATTVANVLFLQTASPLLMPLLAWMVLDEKPARRTLIAVALAVCGLLPIVLASAGGGRLQGDLLALICAVAGATNILIVRRARAVNLIPVVVVAGLLTLFVSLPLARPFEVAASDAIALVLLGAFQIGIGLSLFLFALRHLPAAPVALLTLLEPIVGPLLVWLIIGEVPPAATLLGGSIVILALMICAQATARPSLAPARNAAS